MSIQFNNPSGKNGLIQLIERNLGMADGQISGSTTLMAQFTAEVNLAIDEVFGFLFPQGGTWNLDDANHTKDPFIKTNLVSGQRDYHFTLDEQGNVILDIYRVMVANPQGVYQEILPVDQETRDNNNNNTSSFIDERNLTGTPTRYDKTGNGIFLDLIPNYNYTNGLKVFISREALYFLTSDTTKVAGFAYLFQEYFALRPSYIYARTNNYKNVGELKRDSSEMQMAIKTYYGLREKDVLRRMQPNVENCR